MKTVNSCAIRLRIPGDFFVMSRARDENQCNYFIPYYVIRYISVLSVSYEWIASLIKTSRAWVIVGWYVNKRSTMNVCVYICICVFVYVHIHIYKNKEIGWKFLCDFEHAQWHRKISTNRYTYSLTIHIYLWLLIG